MALRTTRHGIKLEPRLKPGSDGRLDWDGECSQMSKARVVSENIMGREHIPLIALSPIFLLPSHRISIHNFKLDTPMRRIKNALASFSKN